MDSSKPKQNNFDWDNLSVGCTQLDHSQDFFAKKHYEHERWDEIELLQQKMTKTDINADEENASECCPKNYIKVEEKEITPDANKDVQFGTDINDDKENISESPKYNIKVEETDVRIKGEACNKGTANLHCEWSTQKPKGSKGAISKNMPPPPQAYLVKDIYKKKREEAELRRTEEERKLRVFHSRPAPSYIQRTLLQQRKKVHAITMAVTPQVLKNSRENREKRRKKLEEWRQKNQPPKFEHRSPIVLKEKPFIPEKKPAVIQQHPFNLHMEQRLQHRRHFDENIRKAMEEKRKQVEIQEEEREKIEKERIRELRKATTFKARPNPFKN